MAASSSGARILPPPAYARRRRTFHTDELEGRFPTGDANLCTSTLYYDALLSAVSLGRELGVESAQTARYAAQARALARAIDAHFGGEVGGYDTYRYYAGNTLLRSWICMPLIVGLKERSEGTVRALLGPGADDRRRPADPAGQLDVLGSLDALRPARDLQRGAVTARPNCCTAIRSALAGRPYALSHRGVGSKARSATFGREWALYRRITEGLFGIRPTGLRSFDLTPSMPAAGRACPCAISAFRPIDTLSCRARGGRQAPHYGGPARRKTENIPRGTGATIR